MFSAFFQEILRKEEDCLRNTCGQMRKKHGRRNGYQSTSTLPLKALDKLTCNLEAHGRSELSRRIHKLALSDEEVSTLLSHLHWRTSRAGCGDRMAVVVNETAAVLNIIENYRTNSKLLGVPYEKVSKSLERIRKANNIQPPLPTPLASSWADVMAGGRRPSTPVDVRQPVCAPVPSIPIVKFPFETRGDFLLEVEDVNA